MSVSQPIRFQVLYVSLKEGIEKKKTCIYLINTGQTMKWEKWFEDFAGTEEKM